MQYNVYNPYDGFKSIFNHVMNHHEVIKSEDGDVTYESETVIVKIRKPLAEPKNLIDVYCMGPEAVKRYIAQFNDGTNTDGFEYTYYERLKEYDIEDQRINQINWIKKRLEESPNTRRGVAVIWKPDEDVCSNNPPCLQWVQALIRAGNLNLKVLFRSHDVLKGWPSNILAIAEMQRRMAEELNVDVGYLEVISSIPHIYIKSDADLVKETMVRLK